MKSIKIIMFISLAFLFSYCAEEEGSSDGLGTIEVKFDNVVGETQAGILSNAGNQDYPFTTSLGQTYNLTLIKYIVSEMVLEGPEGAYYADELLISADETNGYYLVDESDLTSQRVTLENIPPGVYNQITFKIGIEEDGVEQGASIILDGMFWVWNSGYIGLKVEGQSPDSNGESFGDTIEETNPYGFGYHIGGWGSPNNVREISLTLDDILISSDYQPELHLIMDVSAFMNGVTSVDFSTVNSVHSPSAGEVYADNILSLFSFDHVHNNPINE